MTTVDPRRPTTSDGASPQRWVLLVGDPATGAATRPVGMLGVVGKAQVAPPCSRASGR